MYQVENEEVRIQVSARGAELVSIYDKRKKREDLWQADPAIWKWHAPLLFPLAGKLNGGVYRHEGEVYSMPMHGFARERDFLCLKKGRDQLLFQLTSDEESRAIYPFDFILRIGYQLCGREIIVSYEVENPAPCELPFSIGAHPGFLLPREDLRLIFEKKIADGDFEVQSKLRYYRAAKEGEGIDREHERFLHIPVEGLELGGDLFVEDALIFAPHQLDRVRLVTAKEENYLSLDFTGFPDFVLWSLPQQPLPFLCLEPWYGGADSKGFAGDFSERYGIIRLAAGERFLSSYCIQI